LAYEFHSSAFCVFDQLLTVNVVKLIGHHTIS